MTDFQLTITIDNAGLQTISEAGMSVALLQLQQPATYQIVALLPAATNTILISWTDALSVYVSSTSLQAYSVLQINSQAQALSGQVFTFNGSYISPTGSTDLANTIQLSNGSLQTVTAGLARAFNVNGQLQNLAITTASSLLINGLGSFEIGNQFALTLLGGGKSGWQFQVRSCLVL